MAKLVSATGAPSFKQDRRHGTRRQCVRIIFSIVTFFWILVWWRAYSVFNNEGGAFPPSRGRVRTTAERKSDASDVVSGYLHLVDLKISPGTVRKGRGSSYGYAKGVFCRLDWSVHKADPSKVPVFKNLLNASPECAESKRVVLRLKDVVDAAYAFDRFDGPSLDPTGFVLHESRVGSTLVANVLAAFDPASNRVYSESAPLIIAMKACGLRGETDGDCDRRKSNELIQDVVYLMRRTDDPRERRTFFKIQSIGTTYMHNLVSAYPQVPWMFVYREPVQVMMSHLGSMPERFILKAHCLRTRYKTPQALKDLVVRESGRNWKDISHTEACAAHLAYLCESVLAEHASSSSEGETKGRLVNYANLMDTLLEDVLPHHFGMFLTDEEKRRALAIARKYSKGGKGIVGLLTNAAWKDDTEKKERTASPEIRAAADAFLRPSYEKLEATVNRRDPESKDRSTLRR